MADHRNYERVAVHPNEHQGARDRAEIDQGLRSYMLGIYNYMAIAVGVTGVAAFALATWMTNNPAVANAVFNSPLKWVLMLAPLGFVMVLSFGVNKMSKTAMQATFWAFAVVMGLSISWIFLVYNIPSIVQTFFVTSAAFAGLSLFGYTTKRDLSGMGTFLMMGLIGIILASLVNMFMQSGPLSFAINVIGVLIFAGLTAYDTQRLKGEYDMVAHNAQLMAKSTIMGALSLYLNFINMFMFLLSFMGNRD